MSTSYNGWPVGTRAQLGVRSFPVPDTAVRLALAPGAAPILLWVMRQIDRRVADIDVTAGHRTPDDWGWAYRATRGQAGSWSNHASATAADANATSWPRGRYAMDAAQVAECRRIRGEVNTAAGMRLLDWGGDYRVSPVDQMHWELASHVGPGDVRRAIGVLAARAKPAQPVTFSRPHRGAPDMAWPATVTIPTTAAYAAARRVDSRSEVPTEDVLRRIYVMLIDLTGAGKPQ